MRYKGSVYRPPSEAYSLIVQVTYGCSHNTCAFCSMYKEKHFAIRPLEEVLEDFRIARGVYRRVDRVFLADGDALVRKANELYTILDAKIQGGMSGSNTLVYLETPQKKQLYAYVRGVRQELTRGTQLCNVKLKTQKQDTVAFYVLEAYEIYQQVQQAA